MTTFVMDKNHNWTIVSTITHKNAVPIPYPNARILPDDAGEDETGERDPMETDPEERGMTCPG